MKKNLILIQCKDEVGLVAGISNCLANHKLNILEMKEFVDESLSRFFTRIECAGTIAEENSFKKELQKILPKDSEININPKKKKEIVVLVTKEHHCLSDILSRNYFDTLNAEVKCVIGNYDHLEDFTKIYSLPYFFITHEGKDKIEFENEISKIINKMNPDYIVLAKFMRILSPEFVENYSNQIINIHHSFLPAFVGASPYQQAYERGVKLIGATAHFVTNDLDEGPIITQQIIPVNHNFTKADMVVAGREVEMSVLSRALKLVFQDRVFVTGNKTIVFE